jgi:hypothetical protein
MSAPRIIDELSESIRKFGVTQNENTFNNELDFIMGKLNKIEIEHEDEDQNWDYLQSEYSKLKYLYEIINFYNISNGNKFRESLRKFMDFMDIRAQYYLSQINWHETDPDIKEDTDRIKEFLEMSLNKNDSVEKLNELVKAYQILVPIVEDFRKERYSSELDRDFIAEFEPLAKRPRKN